METFLKNVLVFTFLLVSILMFSLLLIPNKRAYDSMLGGLILKQKLLEQKSSPKLIFVGGSNLPFGLDSRQIEQEYQLPVINMGLHAGVGLRYSINDVKKSIKEGDIVVVVPEYENFYTNIFYGDLELLAVIFDISREGKRNIDFAHWRYLAKFIPTYAAKKLKYSRPRSPNQEIGAYERRSFNEYGDAYIHWSKPRTYVAPTPVLEEAPVLNEEPFVLLKDLERYILDRSAHFIILPPPYQASSYENRKEIIGKILSEMKNRNLPLHGEGNRYKFADSLFFDTYYHLTKQGVDLRTKLVIDDIRKPLADRFNNNLPKALKSNL